MALPIESTYNRLAGLGHWMMTLAGHATGGSGVPRSTALPPSRPAESSTEHCDSNNGRALRISLEGKVVQVVLGDIMAHVDVRIGKSQIESVITRRSAEQLGLKKGDKVKVVIKSTELRLPRVGIPPKR